MFQFCIGLHILVLSMVSLAHPSLGGQPHLTNREVRCKYNDLMPLQSFGIHQFFRELFGVSREIMSANVKASYPRDSDPRCNSSNHSVSSTKMKYGRTLPSEKTGPQAYFALHTTTENHDSGYYGLAATMDIYGYTLNVNQLSTGAIWINNLEGDFYQNLNSIVVGWVVWPAHFNDSRTHLFTAWTKDSHRSTGCVNVDCPGFQLVSGSPIFPGDIIEPVSNINGVRQNITIKVFKDKSSGDWWLHCGLNSDPIPVGYFPASLFSSLSMKASYISVGGHVLNSKRVSSPPMGSGAFASDTGKAASIRDIQLIDEDGKGTLVSNDMPISVTDDKLYSVSPIAGGKFNYGGPGGQSA